MTHPKARSKPRRRERRDPQDRLLITEKGYAMLAVLDFIRGDIVRGYVRVTKDGIQHGRATPCAPKRDAHANDKRAAPEAPASLPEPGESPGARSNPQHEQGCLTPCAPKRDAPAAPGPTPTTPCHVGCTPAHPAGKSEAAPLVNQPETDQ